MEILLHAGLEHPNTLWIGVSAVVAFVLGTAAGVYRLGAASALREEDGVEE